MTRVTRSAARRQARNTTKPPRLGLVVLFIIMVILLVGLTILSISYNWRYADINKEADVFNLIKERLSNFTVPAQ